MFAQLRPRIRHDPRNSRRHNIHYVIKSVIPSLRSAISMATPNRYPELTKYFFDLAKKQYEEAMQSIDERVIEVVGKSNLEIKFSKPCVTEVEIFNSETDIDEQSVFRCPSYQAVDVMDEKPPENSYYGFFNGFDNCRGNYDFSIAENSKCVHLLITACDIEFDNMLRSGIRCFLMDLFVGTEAENLLVLQKLKEAEVKITKELNFPVCTTVIAKLSPRHQYTGDLKNLDSVYNLHVRERIVLTTDRYYSTRGTADRVYVNAHNLLPELHVCDVLAIGQHIQVQVRAVQDNNIFCSITRGGELRSRMPVLFPKTCIRYHLSWEEIESIAFAKEVGINVIISHIAGTQAYVDDLKKTLALLECNHMRLFARIVINEILGCEYDLCWVVESYDGFLIDTSLPNIELRKPQLLRICPNAACFLDAAFKRKRTLLLEHFYIAKRRLVTMEENYLHIFLYPDKFIVRCDRTQRFFYFNLLRERYLKAYSLDMLSKQPYCDRSYTGSDSLARGCASAANEMNAKAVIVCASIDIMAKKISNFRPLIPIVLVTRTKCLMEHVMMFHNVLKLYIPVDENDSHKRLIYKESVYALKFLMALKLLRNDENVLLVYGMNKGNKFPDKYLAYTFDEKNYLTQLKQNLFEVDVESLSSEDSNA